MARRRSGSGGLGMGGKAIVEGTTIQGVEVDFEVDGRGQFTANIHARGDARFDSIELEACDSLEEIRKSATAAISKARKAKAIAVPVTFLNATVSKGWGAPEIDSHQASAGTIGLVHATFRGTHATTDAKLVTLDDGTKVTMQRRGSSATMARRLTEDEAATYNHLAGQVVASIEALEQFARDRQVSASDLVAECSRPAEAAAS